MFLAAIMAIGGVLELSAYAAVAYGVTSLTQAFIG